MAVYAVRRYIGNTISAQSLSKNCMTLSLEYLKAFLVVVEEGSINRAASRLLVAQPALGRQIRLLEESLGAKLLERLSTGVQPTAAGRLLLEHARDILREVTRTEAVIGSYGRRPQGDVVVALPTSMLGKVAAPFFRLMRDQYPLVRLVLREGDSHALQDWMREGTADIALLPEGDSDASLHATICATQMLCFFGRPDMIPGGLRPMPLAEALTYPLAMSVRPNRLRRLVDDAARRLGLRVQPVVECSSGHMLSQLARDGSAFTIQPWIGFAPILADGIAVLPIVEPTIVRSLAVVWSTTRPLSSAADAAKGILESIAKALPSTAVMPTSTAAPD